MKPRFRPREALILYLVLLGCVAVLFLVGLELGRERMTAVSAQPGRAEPRSAEPSSASGEGTVEVYGNLAASEPAPSEVVPPTGPSSEIPEGAAGPEADTPEPSPQPSKPQQPPAPAEQAAGGSSVHYTIQVAAHSSRREAEQTLLRLGAKGFSGRIQEPTPKLGDRFYRVWVGEFETVEQARAREAEIKAAGFLTYVRKTE